MSQKKETTKMNEVFTIELDRKNDSFDIPGVTQLLKPTHIPGAAKEKKEAKKDFTLEPTRTVASPMAAPPSAAPSAPQRLKDLGVLFDFQFTTHQTSYRFQTAVPHAESFVQAWQQELLTDMKLDLKNLVFKEPFHEFRHDLYKFLYAAFGVQAQHFIQVIQLSSDPQRVHVLISKQSLVSQSESVLTILQQSPAEKASANEVSGVIEIDLAS